MEHSLSQQKLQALKEPQIHTKFEIHKIKLPELASIHFEFGRIFEKFELNSELSQAEHTKISDLLYNSLQDEKFSLKNESSSEAIAKNSTLHGPFDNYSQDAIRGSQIFTISGKK